jgi:hypothetical protein
MSGHMIFRVEVTELGGGAWQVRVDADELVAEIAASSLADALRYAAGVMHVVVDPLEAAFWMPSAQDGPPEVSPDE